MGKHVNSHVPSTQSISQPNQHAPQISVEGLSDSNDEDIKEIVKETLGDNPQEAKESFSDALNNHLIEDLFELPEELSKDKEWIEALKQEENWLFNGSPFYNK